MPQQYVFGLRVTNIRKYCSGTTADVYSTLYTVSGGFDLGAGGYTMSTEYSRVTVKFTDSVHVYEENNYFSEHRRWSPGVAVLCRTVMCDMKVSRVTLRYCSDGLAPHVIVCTRVTSCRQPPVAY